MTTCSAALKAWAEENKEAPEDAKIVKLFDTSDWDLIGLSWTKPAKKTEKTDTI